MKFLKKYPVAVVITLLAIAGSIVYSQVVTPAATPEPQAPAATEEARPPVAAEAGPLEIDPSQNDGSSADYLRDGAGVFSQETVDQIEAYNEAWNAAYATRIAVVTVDSVEEDIGDAALEAANELGISSYDMILYLDIGGKDCYFDCGDGLWDAYMEDHNILNTYPDRYLYTDYMAGRYGDGVLKLMKAMNSYFADCFQEIGTDNLERYSEGDGYYYGETGGSIVGIVLLIALVVILLSWIDRQRYRTWYGRYGHMSAPTVMFVPWVFWHRPGGWWWNRHHHGPGRSPRSGTGWFWRTSSQRSQRRRLWQSASETTSPRRWLWPRQLRRRSRRRIWRLWRWPWRRLRWRLWRWSRRWLWRRPRRRLRWRSPLT